MAEDQSISWIVHTHSGAERSNDWYWALGLIAFAGAAISIFLGNFLFAIIIVLGAGSLGVLVAREPRAHWVKVDARGVSLDGTLYPYKSILSFWVEDDADPRLLVSTSGFLSPQLVLPIEDETRASNLRTFLKRYAKEEEQGPHIGEHLAQMLGL